MKPGRTGRRTVAPIAALCALLVPTFAASADGYSSYPFPFESQAVSVPYNTGPYATVGKLFYDDPVTKTAYVCSGAAVASRNKSVVITAAHCLHSGGPNGHFFENFEFVPQRKDFSDPVGSFPWRWLEVPGGWVTATGAYGSDFGALVVNSNSNGLLTDVVGGLGYESNVSNILHWHLEGYPEFGALNGERMYECTASFASSGSSSGTHGVGCDLDGGTSGGPWISSFSGVFGGNGNYLNSVTSYSPGSQPNALYGPYFDSVFNTIHSDAENQ
jgi:V8-like Glu-specific endopeptidase